MIFGTDIPRVRTLPTGSDTVTVVAGTDIITYTNHGLKTGHEVVFSAGTTVMDPLVAGVRYYVIFLTADTFKVALTRDLAYIGTEIDITDTGTGDQFCNPGFYYTDLTNAKIIKDEAVPDILVHKSDISGHKSYVQKGQHWSFEVLIHLFKDAGTAVSGCVQSTDPNYDSFTKASHGFIDDDPVTVSGTLPTGLSENTIYYINYTSTSVFTLALSPDGADIDLANDGTTITVTKADNILLFRTLYQFLDTDLSLWRHKDAAPFLVEGVGSATPASSADYATFRLESINTAYITGEHGTEDVLRLVFKSIDYVDLYWNAGAF